MKKGVRVFLILVVCLGIHVTDVSADLIFEPQNAFYKLQPHLYCKWLWRENRTL